MRRRRRHRKSASVDLNLAAMLDMAFQLLTFFILTFRPAPIEGQLGLHLPPPVPMTKVKSEAAKPSNAPGIESVETLDLYLTANDQGDISLIKVGLRPIVKGRLDRRNMAALNEHLKSIFEIQSVPLDRVQLAVDDRLRYEELMKVVDVCTRQTLPNGKQLQRISFVEMKRPGQTP